MACHRPTLLGQPSHINNPAALAFDMSRHPQQGCNRHHTCSANTSQHIRHGLIKSKSRCRQRHFFVNS